ncbi:MAG: 3-keto-5-aminohexanoate cleavage protein [Myxococcales bacterium]|nr:3-keto-5-aminohexanoate cleavage protein [Myxococcales bacterium]
MQRRDEPVVIEVALNGVATKARNPHVPVNVEELVEDALVCLSAGAQIIHQHDDLGSTGKLGGAAPEHMAECSAAVYREVLREVGDAILYPTANWGGSHEDRWRHQEILAREGLLKMAFLDPGSANIGALGEDRLPAGRFVYDHSFEEVRRLFERAEALRLAPNMAIFEPGFLRVVLAYERAERLPTGSFAKLYFGDRVLFGHPPTRAALDAYLDMLDGSRVPWAVAVLGGDVVGCGLARRALEAGGHLRVGLEDYAGDRTPTNRELVEEAVALCREVGRPVASRKEAAELLGLASA